MTTTAEPTTPTGEFGKSRTRKEDARLITGRTRWTDNITLPGMLHLAVVRSPVAHARITGIDADEARALPGVIARLHRRRPRAGRGEPALRLADHPRPEGTAARRRWPSTPCTSPATASPSWSPATPPTARDATELVEVDYDDLPPVLDMEAALAEGATLLHPDLGTNASAHWVFDSGEAGTGGSATEAIAAAENDPDAIVVRRRFRQQRLIPAFMEPRSVVVDPTGEQLTMWSATQIPHILQDAWPPPPPACPSTSCG